MVGGSVGLGGRVVGILSVVPGVTPVEAIKVGNLASVSLESTTCGALALGVEEIELRR